MNDTRHRIVLTGASGTLGRNFLRLMAHRPDVKILALLRQDSRQMPESPMVEYVRVDNFERPNMGVYIGRFQPTAIVHCAATGMEFPKAQWFDLIRFNVEVTTILCECAAAIPGCHFIFISTGLAYRHQGRPLREEDPLDTPHPYGASKAAADLIVRSAAAEFGVPLTVLRPFSFTGLGDDRKRLFAVLLRAASEGKSLDLSSGLQVRDHCSAIDIASGIIAALENRDLAGQTARVYNLGSGRQENLRNVVEGVISELGLEVKLNFGARLMGKFEPQHLVADIARAQNDLGWRPQHNLAHAVWQLAEEAFPNLKLHEPRESL